jgi:hypothetical protein
MNPPKNLKNLPTINLEYPTFLGFGIPCLVYLIASICGWFGNAVGFYFGFLAPLAFLFYALFCSLRVKSLWKTARRVGMLDFVLFFLCIGAALGSFGFHRNPFLNLFEARVKHEYKNHMPEMQTWALAALKTGKQETYSIDESDWPNWIKIQNFPEPVVVVNHGENMEGRACISITWGSGFLGWGLIVGNPTLQLNNEKWADGIYYFVGQ